MLFFGAEDAESTTGGGLIFAVDGTDGALIWGPIKTPAVVHVKPAVHSTIAGTTRPSSSPSSPPSFSSASSSCCCCCSSSSSLLYSLFFFLFFFFYLPFFFSLLLNHFDECSSSPQQYLLPLISRDCPSSVVSDIC